MSDGPQSTVLAIGFGDLVVSPTPSTSPTEEVSVEGTVSGDLTVDSV